MAIRLFYQQTRYRLRTSAQTIAWIKRVIKEEGAKAGNITFVICTDAVLLPMNQAYLKHNTLTDIITFQYHRKGEPLEGEVYISIDRVKENARQFNVRPGDELHRVMIHGVLHLMGYSDKTAAAKKRMRRKEDTCLSLRK